MIANYHTHTTRCRHADGTDEEYVRAALDGGLQILGFSDHTPYPFPEGYYSNFRMYPERLGDYCESVEALKAQYAGKIQLHLGLEAEYYPAYFPQLLAVLRDTPVEYMILGQHFVGSELGEPYCGHITESEQLLERYCNQVIEAMHTGLFTYIAHPDVIKFVGEPTVYRRHMRRLCQAAKSCGIPLEINGLGLSTGRHYPNLHFWETAAQEGCQAVFGADAHRPEEVCSRELYRRVVELADGLGLTLLPTVPLRSIQ